MDFRLGDLAEPIGARIVGDPERRIHGVRSLEEAGPGDLSFLTEEKHRGRAEKSAAGALVVPSSCTDLKADLLVCDDPALAMIEILRRTRPTPPSRPGIHPTAIVGEGCEIAESASIGAFAVLGERTTVGEDSTLAAHVVVGRHCSIGRGVHLHPRVTLYDGCRLGDRVEIHSGAVIGADGHGYIYRDGYRKVPQVGVVVIGDDVEIGANSTIDRATLEVTRVGAGSKIDNLVQIGHNVELGERAMICAQSGLAGSSRIGEGVILAGQSGIADHLEVGAGVRVGAKSAVLRDLDDGRTVGGTPAIEYSKWRRQFVLLGRLEEIYRRVRNLEQRLETKGGDDA